MTIQDNPDYRLRWPRDLFLRELKAVTTGPGDVAMLLTEAFVGTALVDRYRMEQESAWGSGPNRTDVLTELTRSGHLLPDGQKTQPYFIQRKQGSETPEADYTGAMNRFVRYIENLDRKGYLDDAFGRDCVDSPRAQDVESSALEDRLGLADLWPFQPSDWDEDIFLSLVEVFHDLVARPRDTERFHDWSDCGWHYKTFSRDTGQVLYRGNVNTLLKQRGIPYQLADSGEDIGRVVAATDDAREDLVNKALRGAPASTAGEVAHAIALFRQRTADRDTKRSAVAALARILEDRRTLLKTDLLPKDESDLFNVANNFDIRHKQAKQKTGYDDVFLDWIFWWYLATVELSDRLIARQSS